MQVQWLTSPSKGLSAMYLWWLFQASFAPKMLYAAKIFCANKLDAKSPTMGYLRQIACVQWKIALEIMV